MTRRFDVIVFDWDGTLIDSTGHIATALQEAAADLGLPVPSREDASHVIGLGLLQALAWLFPDLPEARHQELLLAYRHRFLARDHEIRLFPGARELLDELRAAGYKIAVATGKARQGLDRVLAQTQLTDFFDATRCADETASKPDPKMLYELMDELGVEATRMLMVGDTTHDLQLAANAGMPVIAVSCGAHPIHALEHEAKITPNYLGLLADVRGLSSILL